jgi:xanthine dehydrogenase accessory factor
LKIWTRIAEIVAGHGAAAMVAVHSVRGSAPRDAGARMIVRPDGAFHGSIGGGHLEWECLQEAARALASGKRIARFHDQALGPDLGQCCGGNVRLLIETFDRSDAIALEALRQAENEGSFDARCQIAGSRVRREILDPLFRPKLTEKQWLEHYGEVFTPLKLFGAGHVGRALVLALAPLPFSTRWIDNRPEAFPAHIPANVVPVLSSDPAAELGGAPIDTFVVVMTHDHALDLAIAASALLRPFPYVGMIGSDTKRARFERRFREIGLSQDRIEAFHCPVGVARVGGKEPAIIAASVAAQLLQVREEVARLRAAPGL